MERHHRLFLVDRERLEVEGVQKVISFDASKILLATNQGALKMTGEGLHVKQLDLEAEKLLVEGYITSLEYSEEKGGAGGRGILGRLFR